MTEGYLVDCLLPLLIRSNSNYLRGKTLRVVPQPWGGANGE